MFCYKCIHVPAQAHVGVQFSGAAQAGGSAGPGASPEPDQWTGPKAPHPPPTETGPCTQVEENI